jgi:hypothetical protein
MTAYKTKDPVQPPSAAALRLAEVLYMSLVLLRYARRLSQYVDISRPRANYSLTVFGSMHYMLVHHIIFCPQPQLEKKREAIGCACGGCKYPILSLFTSFVKICGCS